MEAARWREGAETESPPMKASLGLAPDAVASPC